MGQSRKSFWKDGQLHGPLETGISAKLRHKFRKRADINKARWQLNEVDIPMIRQPKAFLGAKVSCNFL